MSQLEYGSVTIAKNPKRVDTKAASPSLFDIASIRERKGSKQHKKPVLSTINDTLDDEVDAEVSQFTMSPFSMTPNFQYVQPPPVHESMCPSPTVYVDYDELQNVLYQQMMYYLTYVSAQQGVVYAPNSTNIVYTSNSHVIDQQYDSAFRPSTPYEKSLVTELNGMEFNDQAIDSKPDINHVRIASPTAEMEGSKKKIQIKTKMNKHEFFKFMTKVSHAVSSAVEQQEATE